MDLKDQLLEATVRVISQQGWRAATTRRIAESAGVNEVTLFRYFGSKDELLRQAMSWQAARAPIQALPAEPGDARAELVTWAQQHYAHLMEVRSHIRRTVGEFDADPHAATWSRSVPKKLHEDLERYLTRLRDACRTRGEWDPRTVTSLLLGALFADAITRDFLAAHLPEPAEDVPRRYVELLLAAIGYAE
jgi:AcrR family transcriptional regulator